MVGAVPVGGGAPVAVQSMTCTRTGDAEATLGQVRALAAAGCEIVRVSLPTAEEAPAFTRVVREADVPVIADIHYDWRLALAAIAAGAAGVRINPGTMGEKHVREIVHAAAEARVPAAPGRDAAPVAIRIGVNAGSLPRDLRGRAAGDVPGALVEAALRWATRFEEWGFTAYKLSVKSSSVPDTIAAYRLLAAQTDAPLHVGVTEAGTVWSGTIKSAVGIGALLADGVGDTVRVSLTGDPVEEVRVAWQILAALGLRRRGPEVISCPTCGRTEVDIVGLAEEVERRLGADPELAGRVLSVAVMGCRVNGPEEARHADYGIAAGAGEGVLFDHGERVETLPEGQLVDALLTLVRAGSAGRS
ncbi:MAG TPA: flavodoxin-dependent (E)-4-hydroxy-3-methylbut-2-enyl-diphosphate synthase [Thermoleophilia bacterium]|nr:flavodoxin-dependent (E)-4-hydroxy-3-methylbut-2-enyl-diphosphate synthase [Thermoleophilia bacterium]